MSSKLLKMTTIWGLALCLFGCLRLDDQLFNPEEKITNYRWELYAGIKELPDLPDKYKWPVDSTQFFFLKSGSERIACVFLGDSQSIKNQSVILYCHGNKNHMDNYWNRAKLLAHVGSRGRFGVLMMDYRGYGLSTGKPTEAGLYEDVGACMQWLKSKGLKEDKLVMYGYSLGSAPATRLASGNNILPVSKLILEAPFASAQAMVSDASKLQLPASYFTNLKIDNEAEIKNVKAPLLWFHGQSDDFLSFEKHGNVVYQNHNGPKTSILVAYAGHNDVPSKIGYNAYLDYIWGFLK